VKDISPHDKSRRKPAKGPSKEGTAADPHTGWVHNRIFGPEAEAHGTFRADVDALLTDDTLCTVGLYTLFMDCTGWTLAGTQVTAITGIVHPPAVGGPPSRPAEQGPERADVPAPKAGLKTTQQEKQDQESSHEDCPFKGWEDQFKVGQL
jgi:hypothetical protein